MKATKAYALTVQLAQATAAVGTTLLLVYMAFYVPHTAVSATTASKLPSAPAITIEATIEPSPTAPFIPTALPRIAPAQPGTDSDVRVTPIAVRGVVAGGLVNVRDEPNGHVIGVVENGTVMAVLEEEGGWYRVLFNGRDGWVGSSVMEVK